jgi:acyl-CoA thioesterase YciA
MTAAERSQPLLRSSRGEPSVRTMAMPADANWLGDIFGGWLMSHADIAGATHAYRIAQGKVVTVAVKEFDFVAPVYVGDVVTFFTTVAATGRTSIQVAVKIYAERPGREPGEHIKVGSGTFIYVHVDENRRKMPLPTARD